MGFLQAGNRSLLGFCRALQCFHQHLGAGLEGMLSMLVDSTELEGAAESSEGGEVLQRDLDKPEGGESHIT